jgi:hypothetical protein
MQWLILNPRNIGMTQCLLMITQRKLLNSDFDAPLPWWMKLHREAKQTHRAIDEQVMLATGSDLEAIKERKSKCSSTSR